MRSTAVVTVSLPAELANRADEVDFLVPVDRRHWFAVEAKLSATRMEPSLRYFRDHLGIP